MALGLQRREDDIGTMIARVRRVMPRNPDVMAICDRCELLMLNGAKRERPAPDLEKIRAQTRARVARYRAKKRKGRK